MTLRKILISIAFIATGASAAQADLATGLWQSAPDSSGLVVHVRTKPCGRAICGRVERAKNTRGYDTPSTAVGQRMLWDLQAQSDGSYHGQIRAPDSGQVRGARLKVQGNRMQVESCAGTDCKAEVWQRLK